MKRAFLLLLLLASFTLAAQQTVPEGMVLIPGLGFKAYPEEVKTNDPGLHVLLDEFYDGARFARVDYGRQLLELQGVYYIEGHLNFLGGISDNGRNVLLNAELLKYPNLARVIFLRQFGNLYDLPAASEHGHDIMSPCWVIDQEHEDIATEQRARPHQRKRFFDALHKKHPLPKRL